MERMKRFLVPTNALLITALLLSPCNALSQTKVVAPKNPYALDKDVQLGRQAANEVERQLPLLNNRDIQNYIARVGARLAESIPAEFQHPEFRYSYKVVDVSDINAFALPGGFTYVNRGLLEAAKNEGEMAGVIAHEISHVALRHGTAQVAKAQKYQTLGAIAGVAGSVLGGVGNVAGQAAQMGIGTYFLKFSREYEKQADLLGAHIMANAGYDAHDLANMFKTLEQQGAGKGPQWMSDHPNPGNRFEYINKEADALAVQNPTRDTPEFKQARSLLARMPHARSMQDAARNPQRNQGQYPQDQRYPDDQRYPQDQGYPNDQGGVAHPSTRFQNYSGSFFQMSIPDNWRGTSGSDGLTFAPQGGYYQGRGLTHGLMVGRTRVQARNLRQATETFINNISQNNRNMRASGGYESGDIAGRSALALTTSNVSEVTGQNEVVVFYTTLLRNGDLFYMISVAPQNEYGNYQRTFQLVVRSLQLRD